MKPWMACHAKTKQCVRPDSRRWNRLLPTWPKMKRLTEDPGDVFSVDREDDEKHPKSPVAGTSWNDAACQLFAVMGKLDMKLEGTME